METVLGVPFGPDVITGALMWERQGGQSQRLKDAMLLALKTGERGQNPRDVNSF